MNDRPVHEAHKKGFLLAISEALLLQANPEVVSRIVSLLVAPGVTYEEMNALPERAVTRALDKATAVAGLEVPETRVEYLLNLLPLLSPALRFCGACHTLDLRPKAGKWITVEGGSCYRCKNGIYESVAFDKGPVSWVNGRTYDPGTEMDENRNPLTDGAILDLMVSRGTPIDPEILKALGEPASHMSIVDLCAYINHTLRSATDTLRRLENYHNLAVDPVALRLYLRGALQSMGQRTVVNEKKEVETVKVSVVRGSKPVEPRVFNRNFYRALAEIYPTIAEVTPFLKDFGIHTRVNLNSAVEYVWGDAIQMLESMGKLTQLLEETYAANPEKLAPVYESYIDMREVSRVFHGLPIDSRRQAALASGMNPSFLSGPYPMDPLSWFGHLRQHASMVNLYNHLKASGFIA